MRNDAGLPTTEQKHANPIDFAGSVFRLHRCRHGRKNCGMDRGIPFRVS
jgi:hypothetical protein